MAVARGSINHCLIYDILSTVSIIKLWFSLNTENLSRVTSKKLLSISGNFWYNNTIEAQDEDMKGIESGFWGFTKSTFKLKSNQEIQLIGKFSTTMKVTTGEISPMRSMDFAYKKEVDDRFNITVKVKDLFDSGGFHIITDQNQEINDQTINQLMDAEFRRNKRTISLSFEYKFGEFKKKKYIRDNSNNYDRGSGDGMGAGY